MATPEELEERVKQLEVGSLTHLEITKDIHRKTEEISDAVSALQVQVTIVAARLGTLQDDMQSSFGQVAQEVARVERRVEGRLDTLELGINRVIELLEKEK